MRLADRYESFQSLAAREIEGVHYRIHVAARSSPVVVVAPHGGLIEPGTSEVAAAIAADRFSLYCFESLTMRARGDGLHITSTRFDEPRALRLIEASDVAIGVHGRKNGEDEASVWVGGLHETLRDAICDALLQSGFRAKTVGEGHRLAGRDPANICNRGRRREGVQIEMPKALRIKFAADAAHRHAFADAVRAALSDELAGVR
ncbi:poly-gamma-glutamate hydrolase family protein [Methylocystis sp. ATCC 49242]|uniref:poly-gamma-glutamate hydrolase family protein n=1 Tax=Methylocystis sp. ATCC 49242 TaxID=622637 RepID=UPI000564668F|nr:poly-gamma-glutamate hydrolase family protein [Methylocystis sp. ATCC 49242]